MFSPCVAIHAGSFSWHAVSVPSQWVCNDLYGPKLSATNVKKIPHLFLFPCPFPSTRPCRSSRLRTEAPGTASRSGCTSERRKSMLGWSLGQRKVGQSSAAAMIDIALQLTAITDSWTNHHPLTEGSYIIGQPLPHLVEVEPVFSVFSPGLRVAGDGLLGPSVALAADDLSVDVALVVAPVDHVQVELESLVRLQGGLSKDKKKLFSRIPRCLLYSDNMDT